MAKRRNLFYQKLNWETFFSKTVHLNHHEKGAYLFLIGHYFNLGGPLPDDDVRLAAMTFRSLEEWRQVRPEVQKFFDIQGGLWHHERVERDLRQARNEKQAKKEAARQTNKKRYGEPDGQRHAQRHQTGSLSDTLSGVQSQSQSQSHSTSVEREYTDSARPSLEELLAYAQRIGLAPWKATDWFQEMEGCGWLDYKHRPIIKWQSVLDRVRVKWEADGRPMQPPRQPGSTKAYETRYANRPQRPDRNAGTYNEAARSQYTSLGKLAGAPNPKRPGA